MQVYLPDLEVLLSLHDSIIEVSGGRSGVLNKGMAESAVYRPKTYLSYRPECDIHTVCAVLLDSIARNHAFADGNKRTSIFTVIFTYELNDIILHKDAYDNFEELVLWLVKEKPGTEKLARELREIVETHQVKGISKFAHAVRKLLIPVSTKSDE